MVKVYKKQMPAVYTYDKAGIYQMKIVGNLSSAAFSGSQANGLVNVLTKVEKFDDNLRVLEDNAFNGCIKLRQVNMETSNILSANNSAFAGCPLLKQLKYNSKLEYIGQYCFSNTPISLFSPVSYEEDISNNVANAYQNSNLTILDNAAFYNNNELKCIVIPEKVKLFKIDSSTEQIETIYYKFFENVQNLQHIIFLGMNQSNIEEYKQYIKQSNMFGLEHDCTFEGVTGKLEILDNNTDNDIVFPENTDNSDIVNSTDTQSNTSSQQTSSSSLQSSESSIEINTLDGTAVFKYIANSNEIIQVPNTTSYFNINFSTLPKNGADLEPGHIYKYDNVSVNYCLNNKNNFIVIYLDSKTSIKTKQFLINNNINILFEANAPNAIIFILDRHDEEGQLQLNNINHYRNVMLDIISRKQLLIHSSTDTKALLEFPEASFVSMGGLKFQKTHLVENEEIGNQISIISQNIFN